MICKICGTYVCELVSERTTMLGFFSYMDKEGNWHHHDGNFVTQEWKCEHDHTFSCGGINHCWCGWNSAKDEK